MSSNANRFSTTRRFRALALNKWKSFSGSRSDLSLIKAGGSERGVVVEKEAAAMALEMMRAALLRVPNLITERRESIIKKKSVFLGG